MLAKAVGQLLERVAGLAPSRASPLPHLGCISRLEMACAFSSNAGAAPRISSPNSNQNCGSGLARESGGSVLERVAGLAHSRASPLPHLGCISRLEPGCVACSNAGAAPRIPSPNSDQNCGSGLARESGGSVAGEGDWSGAFAGKPAPTFGVYSKVGIGLYHPLKCRCSTPNSSPNSDHNCGSGLARESGGSVAGEGGWSGAFAGKPAPTFGVYSKVRVGLCRPLKCWCSTPNPKPNSNQNCGSGLARESGGSVAGEGDWSGAFAGKPAPTFGVYFKVGIGLCRPLKCLCSPPNPSPNSDQNCGSGLARESGGSVAGEGGWSGAFASKPAPTLGVYFKVGAELCRLLKCRCSTPNPKPGQRSKLWERACPRKRWVSCWRG